MVTKFTVQTLNAFATAAWCLQLKPLEHEHTPMSMSTVYSSLPIFSMSTVTRYVESGSFLCLLYLSVNHGALCNA